MPLPKPKNKEKRKDFIQRCMSEMPSDEFKDPKQRVAVCYNQYKEAKATAEGIVEFPDDEMLILKSEN